MKERLKFRFKIVVIGDTQVGKTSLMKKFTIGGFSKDYSKMIGASFSKYEKEIEGDEIRLIFWKIASSIDVLFLRPIFLNIVLQRLLYLVLKTIFWEKRALITFSIGVEAL